MRTRLRNGQIGNRSILPDIRTFCPFPTGRESLLFPIMRLFLSALSLLLFSGSVESTDWHVLHSELGARVISQTPAEGSTAFNFQLPDSKACIALGCPVHFPLVIDDLVPRLQVQSDQVGVALGAQVVLPRTIHPGTKRPMTYIVPGSKYTGSGNWETLTIPNLQKESDRIAALLQAELKMPFDLRGQYVRQIILFVERLPEHGESKHVNAALPHITGHSAADVGESEEEFVFDPLNYVGFKISVSASPVFLQGNFGNTAWTSPLQSHVAAPLVAAPVSPALAATRTAYAGSDPSTYTLTSLNESPTSLIHIQFNDGVLKINDTAIGVRAIEYREEPLAMLRALKFNAVWLTTPPSPELRLEAQQAGIWLICPPPHNAELETAKVFDPNALGRSTPTLDASYDNVLVWNLGNECSYAGHVADTQRVHVLRNADRIKRRPILCTARSGVYDYSCTADILMMFREPLFSSLDLLDLRTWQRTYPTLARDASFWCTVQTQPSPKMTEQWTQFEGNPPSICAVSYEQIKTQIYLALAAGAHGILFTSHTPLTNNDPETEFRRAALELANWELQLVEEWFAAGEVQPTVAKSNQSHVSSAIIRADRSRLLVPIWQERHNQSAIGAAMAGHVQYIVSGIPETYRAYHLVPGRLMPMESQRVAGGVQIELEEASLNSLIFFGEEDAIQAQVGQRATLMGPRTAYLACRLAELELAMTEQVLTALRRVKDTKAMPIHPKDNLPLIAMPEHESMTRTTKEAIDFAKNLAERSPPDYAQSYLQAERATRGLRYAGRSLWLEATRHDLNLCMTPVSVSFATLPLFLSAYQRTNGAKLGANRLPGGDMEMRSLEQAGWEPMAHKVEGAFVAQKEISPIAMHSGKTGLRLVVAPTSPADKPKQLETVPLWVATPPMSVRAGEMICVHGWIRIPQPLESTVDGLMIFDPLGGEELALRFVQTAGEWREFAFYRNVPADSNNYYVFFALGGIGEVHLDDIRVSAVQFDVQTQPAVQPATPVPSSTPYWQRLNPFQYIPPMPGRR